MRASSAAVNHTQLEHRNPIGNLDQGFVIKGVGSRAQKPNEGETHPFGGWDHEIDCKMDGMAIDLKAYFRKKREVHAGVCGWMSPLRNGYCRRHKRTLVKPAQLGRTQE